MKVLFFTPHVALWVHTVPEALLARALKELGHEVEYLTCGKAQSYCACMTAARLAPAVTRAESANVCRACEQGVDVLKSSYGFTTFSLAGYLHEGDHEDCVHIAREAVRNRSLSTLYLDIDVGRIALYEFTLLHKKMSTELSAGQWVDYGIFLENALITLKAFSRHLADHRPDAVVTFSPQYSNINSCAQFALANGVRVLFIESGTNLSHRLGTMRVWDWDIHKLVNPALRYWSGCDEQRVSKSSAQAVTGHFTQLLGGRHYAVFSAPYVGGRGIRERWGIKDHQRVALLTLSSYDEAYAALLIGAFPPKKVFSDVFRTQAEWLAATIEWAKSKQEIFFVVRVHPRDFPNKREALRSEQSYALEKLLSEVPGNVHVNWPSENISLYEILEDADAVVTGWSVTAMEALILGIPVVTYDQQLPSYPADIMLTGRTQDAYFDNLERALEAGWSISNVRNGFRWLAYNFVDCTLPVSERFGAHELASRGLVKRAANRLKNHVPAIGRRLDLLGWREAIDGARIMDRMLRTDLDAIPPARSVDKNPLPDADEHAVIDAELGVLLDLLSKGVAMPLDKPGLAHNIRRYLNGRETR